MLLVARLDAWAWSPPGRAVAPAVDVAGRLLEQLGPLDQLAQLEHEHRARWRSASSTPIGSCSRSTDSSWPTAGRVLITTRVRTGTGSSMTCHRPSAAQAKMATPRTRDRSRSPRT